MPSGEHQPAGADDITTDDTTDGRHVDHLAPVLPFPSLGRRPEPVPAAGLREVIGEVLREERHRQERTLADVAETASVSLPYLSEVERGRKEISSDLLDAVSGALDLTLVDLLERSVDRLRARMQSGSGIQLRAA